jgi:radical SAM protein with 4Fe4S-binding SPASM domain
MLATVWFFRRRTPTDAPRDFRYERFGGIVHLTRPRALVFVDRERARSLGWPGDASWELDENINSTLSAPLEAHLQLTNRCDAGCKGCYTGATPEGGPREWGLDEWKRALDELGARGVFHLALGGGESALLPWLGEIASYARARGMVPNLTTSGLYDDAVLARLVEWAPLFGQINVSVDGTRDGYQAVRGFDGLPRAEQALRALRAKKREIGINCVVTRQNFDELGEVFRLARRLKLNEVELLRLKPSGRGTRVYAELRCTDEQHASLLPTVLKLSRKHRMRVHLDCSYTPMVAHHKPAPKLMRWLAIYGCAGGDLLAAAKSNGALSACSFAAPVEVPADQLGEYWKRADAFGAFRRWPDAAEPCRSCDYHALCRGGCRVVSSHVAGSASAPDPECPRVIAHTGNRRLPIVG